MMKTCGTASSFFAHAASALTTRPGIRAWGESLLLLGVFGLVAVYLGLGGGLINFSVTDEYLPFIVTALVALLVPALSEELVFRVALPWCGSILGLPARLADLAAIALFVIWHPVQVWLGLPLAQPIFLDPEFLLLASLLGLVCLVSYRRSGSIWPAVVMHWIVVISWKGLTVSA